MEKEQSISTSERKHKAYVVTIVGSIGNFLLLAFKLVSGILGHSSAMLADAVHSLSDFITDIIVLVFMHISSKPHDTRYQYGYGKYETLATTIIGITLLGVGAGILYDSCSKILLVINGGTLQAPGWIALIAALVSIVVKEAIYQYSIRVSRKLDSPMLAANAWHHRSDALSSVGALIGIGGAILLGDKWTVLDPIAAFIVGIFIIKVALRLVGPAVDELLERSLPAEDCEKILEVIKDIPEADHPHNLRTRRIGNYSSVEIHVRMDGDMTVAHSHEITRLIERRIKEALGENTFVNVHVEPIKEPAT